MLLATARFVITSIQRKFLYFFVFFFPKVPRSIQDGLWEVVAYQRTAGRSDFYQKNIKLNPRERERNALISWDTRRLVLTAYMACFSTV